MAAGMRYRTLDISLGMFFAALFFIQPAYSEDDPAKRQAYYGETHLHTSWSFDAYIFGDTMPARHNLSNRYLISCATGREPDGQSFAPPCRQAGHLDLPRRRLGQGIRT